MDQDDTNQRITEIFNSAADYFDAPALSFWNRFGQRTIDRLSLQSGDRVLDVCCGTGASAISAAEKVGATGSVLGIDLAEDLLKLGREKAALKGLNNIEFRSGDFAQLDLPDGHFDTIVCVFGIFFLPDMEAAITELWRMLRPGGQLAVTSWGSRIFEPANTTFWNAIKAERPELYKQFTPWYRIGDPESLKAMLEAGGATQVEVIAEIDRPPLATAEDWWTMAMGGGLRGAIDQFDPHAQARLKAFNLDFLQTNHIHALHSDVLYASAVRR